MRMLVALLFAGAGCGGLQMQRMATKSGPLPAAPQLTADTAGAHDGTWMLDTPTTGCSSSPTTITVSSGTFSAGYTMACKACGTAQTRVSFNGTFSADGQVGGGGRVTVTGCGMTSPMVCSGRCETANSCSGNCETQFRGSHTTFTIKR